MGNMFLNIFSYTITFSFTYALETYVGQAHGKKDKKLCALYTRRQQINSTLFWIPSVILLLFSQ
jgi:Na+-driven multidrug efflux pump